MKRNVLLVLLIAMAAACARPRPALTPPRERVFVEVPRDPSEFAEDESEMDPLIPPFNPLTGAGVADQIKAQFRGQHRKVPKTTIAPGSRKKFKDVGALAASLPDDSAMLSHAPPIKRDTMTRAVEEQRNVRVAAWIYAITYEKDQDWHLILGTAPGGGPKTYFNAEVSGLPASSASAFATLQKVRNQLAQILDNKLPGVGTYHDYGDDAVPVIVEGSLFFDVDHPAGEVGPDGKEPKTAWEIHPITNLRLQ